MMSAATAPTARADDYTDVIAAIGTDFGAGQADFSKAFVDFGSSEVDAGLAKLFAGVDDYFLSAPDNLYAGSVDLLTNAPVLASIAVSVPPETDFASGMAAAEAQFSSGASFFATAATDLSSADYAGVAEFDSFGSLYDVIGVQVLLEGVVASF